VTKIIRVRLLTVIHAVSADATRLSACESSTDVASRTTQIIGVTTRNATSALASATKYIGWLRPVRCNRIRVKVDELVR